MAKHTLSVLFLCLFTISAIHAYESLPVKAQEIKASKHVLIYLDTELLNTEIGASYLNLAEALLNGGHSVSLLHNQPLTSDLETLVTYHRGLGLHLQLLPTLSIPSLHTPHHIFESYSIFEYLRTQNYDVIHFPAFGGKGYYSALARHQGLAFPTTPIVVGVQTPYMASKINNLERPSSTSTLEIDFMQRKSIQLADIIISPSEFMLNYLTEQRMILPERAYVQPNLVSSRIVKSSEDSSVMVPNEIVYFGDLSGSEGILLFCDALDIISPTLITSIKVTFLGVSQDLQGVDAREYLTLRARKWGKFIEMSVISGKDRYESLRYLMGSDRLAVVCPELTNIPLRVQELLASRIHFVASNVGGIPEVLTEEDQTTILFEPRRDKLANLLSEVLQNGISLPAGNLNELHNKMSWNKWHSQLTAMPLSEIESTPLASVIITHFNRPHYLKQAVASVMNQDYSNYEVILVDDASTDEESIKLIEEYKTGLFLSKGWTVVQLSENSYLGKARNVGAQSANGKYLIFLDDDNVAKSNEISTFVKVAERTQADLLTSFQDNFVGDSEPTISSGRRIPLGGDLATGFYWNCFGDANSLIRKDSFLQIGGFSEDYAVGYEDYEMFIKALMKGLKLEVVVESLFWYRVLPTSMSTSTPLFKNRMRYLRSYVDNLSPELSNLLIYSQAMHYGRESAVVHSGVDFIGVCSGFGDCGSCNENSNLGCSWCYASGQCESGNSTQSPNCTIDDGWWWNKTCLDCGKFKDCEDCAAATACGWCDDTSTCLPGNGLIPFKKGSSCNKDNSEWYYRKADCPGDNRKALAIIIGCAISGFVLFVIIAAVILCVVMKRRARYGGYTPINQNLS